MEANLSEIEMSLKRFARHFLLPGFTHKHQTRLHKSRVVVVGMGGLGNSVAQCLAAAGVGGISIIDYDIVEESNLSRQILFNENDLGISKVHAACQKLSDSFPGTKIHPIHEKLSPENGEILLNNHDLILDCCDLTTAKYDIDAAAAALNIPVVFGAVNRFDGQVAVFHGKSKSSYSKTFPRNEATQLIDNCNTLGVWSPSVGIIGNVMAQEALTMLAFGDSKLEGHLLNIHLANYECHVFKLNDSADSHKGTKGGGILTSVTTISSSAVDELRTVHKDIRFIWLNNDEENTPAANAEETEYMSLDELLWSSAKWDKNTAVVLQCKSGIKSMQGALALTGEGFTQVYQLKGE
jgi:adenylyltransferase/sulfurtransferase